MTICCGIVEPPCLMPPLPPMLAHAARAMPIDVEAGVLPEAAILGGDERGEHVRRHALEADERAVLDREGADLLAVGGEDQRLAARLIVGELAEVLRQLRR